MDYYKEVDTVGKRNCDQIFQDTQLIDVNGAKGGRYFGVMPDIKGGQEIIHITGISPASIVGYLSPSDFVQASISPDGKVDGITLFFVITNKIYHVAT